MLETRCYTLFVFSCFFDPMYNQPKTPSRARARSEAKTPLTPSIFSSMNNISLASSPTKQRSSRPGGAPLKSKPSTNAFDMTNPFISSSQSKSRVSSPVKCIAAGGIPNSDSFQRQASGGVIRKGGVESRLDVVTRDYVPPPPKYEVKRSKSTPASVRMLPSFSKTIVRLILKKKNSRTESDLTNATALLPIAIPQILQSYPPLSIKFH